MFLAAVCGGLLFAFDIASFDYGAELMNLSVFNVDNQVDATYFSGTYTWPLVVLAVIMTALPIYTLFRFKKRNHQIKMCQLDMLLNLVFAVLVLLYYVPNIQKTIGSEMVAFKIGTYIPVVSLIFNLLAIKGIRKDIELLRSVDRIR